MNCSRHVRFAILAVVLSASLSACVSVPRPPVANVDTAAVVAFGDEVALRAIAQVGKPYRYGGADLQGFDCSGLVYFVYRDLGVDVPRTAAEQYANSTPVNVHSLEPGDLLFFRTTSRRRVTHVAIYAGNGRFVHAPQSGRTIELRELNDDYYAPRLVGAGRFYAPNALAVAQRRQP